MGLPSSSTSGASTGTIWLPKRSSDHAAAARCWDSKPNLSASSRLMPHLSAMRSAPSNWEVNSYRGKYDFGIGRPKLPLAFEPIGTRLMVSTPQATATSATPAPTRLVARFVACCEDPHWVSTVVAATERGRPALSQAVRAMLNACSPIWLTQPPTTWSTTAGSMPERSISAPWIVASSSAGCMVDKPPFRFPTGLRTASTITTSVMG